MTRLLALVLALSTLPLASASAAAAEARPSEVDAWRPLHGATGGAPREVEDGCSVLFHVCSCHPRAVSAPATGGRAPAAPAEQQGSACVNAPRPGTARTADPPPLPPPIA